MQPQKPMPFITLLIKAASCYSERLCPTMPNRTPEKLQLDGRAELQSLSKRLPSHGLWLSSENAAVQGLQFPGNRTAFVPNRSAGIPVTGVSSAEETRAKPLTDAGSGQGCYHQIRSSMYKINPLRIATRSHLTFYLP